MVVGFKDYIVDPQFSGVSLCTRHTRSRLEFFKLRAPTLVSGLFGLRSDVGIYSFNKLPDHPCGQWGVGVSVLEHSATTVWNLPRSSLTTE